MEVQKETVEGEDSDDLLGGENLETNLNQEILKLLEDEENRVTIREIVLDVIQSQKLKELEKKKKNFVLTQLKKANSALLDALNNFNLETNKKGVKEQLKSIATNLSKLEAKIDEKS